MKKIEENDCGGAQKYYNFKELAEKYVVFEDVLLADYGKEKNCKIGDYMTVGNQTYTVAYITDWVKRGLTVINKGWERWLRKYVIPKRLEWDLIYANRNVYRLYDIYFPYTEVDSSGLTTKDFSTGEVSDTYSV